jgi:hypothetical protein
MTPLWYIASLIQAIAKTGKNPQDKLGSRAFLKSFQSIIWPVKLFGRLAKDQWQIFGQWRHSNSFKHSWARTCERVGVHDLHFYDFRHTFSTRRTEGGVDYAGSRRSKVNLSGFGEV